ncbi:MAG: lipid-A-disaccharide synthase N-terminal domain-containing protein [Bacteroidales bacterium]|nr:lipid-A-disaccharide synthase N-terminal domain-containing protein [Bacteroidales bacterium]
MDNLWLYALGLLAQGLFAARMLVQWIRSEKARRVVNPTVFWLISLVASLLFFLYGWLRADFALMLGQVIGYLSYIWNLGAKGIWEKLGRWHIPVVILLLAVPIAVAVRMSMNWEAVTTALFRNEGIPIWMVVFGSVGQVVFASRFIYQTLYSARRGESMLPLGFWLISTAGTLLILVYGILRRDPVVILSQCCGLVTYLRNLILLRRSNVKKNNEQDNSVSL